MNRTSNVATILLAIILNAGLLPAIYAQNAYPTVRQGDEPDDSPAVLGYRADTLIEELNFVTDSIGLADSIPDEMDTVASVIVKVDENFLKKRFKEIQKEIPMSYHKIAHQYVNYFMNENAAFTRKMLEIKGIYFPIYEAALAKYGLPDELKYLSVIESRLEPKVVSYAGAGGLWQFMRSTGQEFGLRQNKYVDERFDPVKSTDAACRYIAQLYAIFEDWELALAAYNVGPGAVRRAMRRTGGSTFWEIHHALPEQTRNYVPKLVAMIYIMNSWNDHGIRADSIQKPIAFDTLRINGFIDLKRFSGLSGISLDEIRNDNPQILSNILPPNTRDFLLRIPAQSYSIIKYRLKAMLDSSAKWYDAKGKLANVALYFDDREYTYKSKRLRHKIKYGESISTIAVKFGVTSAQIRRWNNLQGNNIRAGKYLSIMRRVREVLPAPILKAALPNGASAALIDSQADRAYLALAPNEIPILLEDGQEVFISDSLQKALSGDKRPQLVRHSVVKNESLEEIAARYRISVDSLKKWNKLKGSLIRPGQSLVIHARLADKDIPKIVRLDKYPKLKYHTVQKGDSLWTISRRYGLTIETIKKTNRIKGNSIRAGMKLLISG